MKNFQLLPCNDNLIFAYNPEGDDAIFIKKRLGLLVENIEQSQFPDDGFDNYRTLFVDFNGQVCDYSYDVNVHESYCPICLPGQPFVPKTFDYMINNIVRFWEMKDTLNEIVKLGGVKQCPENKTIKITVYDNFEFKTRDDFYTFGFPCYVNNPFKGENNENYCRVLDIAVALQHYRDFYELPDLKVETTFLDYSLKEKYNSMEQEEYDLKVAEEKRREAEWKPVLDLMINRNLTLEEAQAALKENQL